MSKVNGQLNSCDRCGKSVFLKCTGKGETDGGFTRWNNFEPLPAGWENHLEVGLLCPSCNAGYARMLDDFQKRVNYFKTGESGNG